MNDRTINIRSIQHYMYCPRRFALLEINKDWQENAFVVKADIMHEHVHDGSHDYSDSRKVVRSAVSLFNDDSEYDLYGIADCIEFIKAADGVSIAGLEGKYRVQIVEYKPQAPKSGGFNETDAIQVFAQKLCADYVWNCRSDGYIYYADIRKRIKLPFNEEFGRYDEIIRRLLREMRDILGKQYIPTRARGQKCSGCSLGDICFPKVLKYCVKDLVNGMRGGDNL